MSKHTPGPWSLTHHFPSEGKAVHTLVVNKFHIGVVVTPRSGQELLDRRLADARLISAAPDLLAALQALVKIAAPHLTSNRRYWREGPDGESSEYCEETTTADELDMARAAIAKATGAA